MRLARFGRTHNPFYRIVVADSRKRRYLPTLPCLASPHLTDTILMLSRDGRHLECLGTYDPKPNKNNEKVSGSHLLAPLTLSIVCSKCVSILIAPSIGSQSAPNPPRPSAGPCSTSAAVMLVLFGLPNYHLSPILLLTHLIFLCTPPLSTHRHSRLCGVPVLYPMQMQSRQIEMAVLTGY